MSANENTVSTPKTGGRGLNITLWVLQIGLALFFAFGSTPKLFAMQGAPEMFDKIGYGNWFMYFTGVVELAGAIGLVIPRLSSLAASGLAIVMLCATVANIVYLEMPEAAPMTVLLAALFGFIAWGRRTENRKLLATFKS
ncbi:MAG: DoxX family protein [Stackebrandtia sp.]